ncbi:MAG: PQQ-binding-like beta-propeller repeat protein [Acidobacteriota bacterium]
MRRVALLLLPFALFAQDWPQLLGPNRDGVYNGPFSPKPPLNKLWEHKVGEAFSAPVVAQGRVLVYHRIGDEDILESLDAATGKTQWTFKYKTTYRDDFGFLEGPRAAPTVDGDRIYLFSAESVLRCVNLTTGKLIWQVDARERFGAAKEYFGAAPAPIVEGKLLLANVGGRRDGGIVGLDKMTGATVWKAAPDEAGYSSPNVVTINGARHALFFTRTGLIDADPANGNIRFQMRWRARMAASVNSAVPQAAGSLVFLSASYGTGATVLDISGNSYKQLWQGDDQLSNHYSTSVILNGYLYGWHGRQEMGQELRCIEMRTGKVQWSVPNLRAGTVTLMKDHLLVITESGDALISPATPAGFQPVFKKKLLDPTIRSYPALSEGRLYVRNEQTLAAFTIR